MYTITQNLFHGEGYQLFPLASYIDVFSFKKQFLHVQTVNACAGSFALVAEAPPDEYKFAHRSPSFKNS